MFTEHVATRASITLYLAVLAVYLAQYPCTLYPGPVPHTPCTPPYPLPRYPTPYPVPIYRAVYWHPLYMQWPVGVHQASF